VEVFFVRGVPTNLRFVLMLWGKEMVQTPRQPKHGIDAHEHPRHYPLFWLFFIFHYCKGKFFRHYYFLIVKNGCTPADASGWACAGGFRGRFPGLVRCSQNH